ncbi:hypothetical protein [Bacillus atrophaeus]|uniref:hypothetical protein n=1 Tax=Bacillus atrophaeus TaxID=1452 RepID=UPI001CB948C8|nr:hypothetical protein [Bacillus atrophaeus]MED1122535.1 hypothetical protein [Bacillus atrophaeus]
MKKQTKLTISLLLLGALSAGCAHDKTTAIPKEEKSEPVALDIEKPSPKSDKDKLEEEHKNLKLLETKRHTEKLEEIEAAKKQAAEEAEMQRQEELAERQAEETRQQEQAKAARQQEQAKAAESANGSASSANRSDAAQAQEPAADLPENDGYGYAERKKWHDDQVEWGIKQGYIDPEDAP